MSLDELPLRRGARIAAIDWEMLRAPDAKRLRELGFEDGASVEPLHRAPFGRDPLACRIGRMTVAIRRAHARAITVELDGAEPEAA